MENSKTDQTDPLGTYHEVQLVKSIGEALIRAPDVKSLFCAFMEGLVEKPSLDASPQDSIDPAQCTSQ